MEPPPSDLATDEFYTHAAAALASLAVDSIQPEVDFVLEQQICDGDALVGHYHVRIADGAITVIPGAADSPQITLRQDTATARALRDGSLHAQGAFLTGKLSVDGDVSALLEHGELLATLLRSSTERR